MRYILIVLAHLAVPGGLWLTYGIADPLLLSRQMLAHGDLRDALRQLQAVVKRAPNGIEAHFRLGALLLQLGEPIAAEKHLRFARENGWEPREVYPRLAQAYLQLGRYRDVLREFVIETMPPGQQVVMLSLRAMAQLRLGDADAAVASALEAERMAPDGLPPKLALAHIALARNDPAYAEVKVDQALALNALAPEAMLLKGQLLNRKDDRGGALAVFEDAIRMNPNLLAVRLEHANTLMAAGRGSEARVDVDFVLKAEPGSPVGNYLDAVLCVRAADYLGADLALTRIRQEVPQFPLGLYYLALVKYHLGQGEQAVQAAGRHLLAHPDDPQAVKLYARVELTVHRPAGAITRLVAAVNAGRGDGEMLDLLGRAYMQSREPVKAIQSFERAAMLVGDDDPALRRVDILRRLESIRFTTVDARP